MKKRMKILPIIACVAVIGGMMLTDMVSVKAEEVAQKREYEVGLANEEVYTEGNFTYVVQEGNAWVKKYIGEEEHVVVPSELGGYPVTVICQGTFENNDVIKSITFSEGLQAMQSSSIYYCDELTSISLPATFGSTGSSVGMGGFIHDCKKVSEIKVAKNNTSLKVVNGALYTYDMETLVFYPPGNTQEVFVIPEGVKIISDDSCRDNKYVKEIVMPDTVTYIGYWSFIHDSSLEKINISKNCEIIGQFAIQNTSIKELEIPASVEWIMDWGISDSNSKLENIIVDENNPVYYSEDGVLYCETTLVLYPQAKAGTTYSVKEGTTVIGVSAFGYTELEEIILPNTIKTIRDRAFWDCTKLSKLNLPNGIEEIGEYAFANTWSLKNIVFPYSLTTLSEKLLLNVKVATIQENVTEIQKQDYYSDVEALYFTGNAPQNIENIIPEEEDELLTIYYPSGNTTWNDVVTKYQLDNVTWKEHTHTVDSTWVEDWPATKESDGQSSQICKECGAVCETKVIARKQGMNKAEDGNWYYYVDNEVDTSYTGMAKNAYGWWYIKDGKLDQTYTGMAKNAYGWWYMKKGKLDQTYTGLATNEYGTWYMKKGKLDKSVNGMVKVSSGWVYIKNGKFDTTYTGMAKNQYGWWYMKNGELDQTYTGMAKNQYGWWYMKNGKLDQTYTGMAKNQYGWFYMKNGKLDSDYEGIAQNEWGSWYMANGKLQNKFNGTKTFNGVTYTIKNGKVIDQK